MRYYTLEQNVHLLSSFIELHEYLERTKIIVQLLL